MSLIFFLLFVGTFTAIVPPNCNKQYIGDDWSLVRRVSPTYTNEKGENIWHPISDKLQGNEIYNITTSNQHQYTADDQFDSQDIYQTFSKSFNDIVPNYNEILLSTYVIISNLCTHLIFLLIHSCNTIGNLIFL